MVDIFTTQGYKTILNRTKHLQTLQTLWRAATMLDHGAC